MIWNPWKRIAELEKKLAIITEDRNDWMDLCAKERTNAFEEANKNAVLRTKLANALFRDPKTGRIGKKGAVK